jgi:replicative DNA helicase
MLNEIEVIDRHVKLKSKTDLTEEERKIYKDLFVNRSDVYLIQKRNGEYLKKDAELTDDVLFSDCTVGPYQLNKESKIKYACMDVDVKREKANTIDFDIKNWETPLKNQIKNIFNALRSEDIPYNIEFSGRRGYHVWVFFKELVDAGIVKNFFEKILKTVNVVDEHIGLELFPKQKTVTNGGYGNFVKLPLQKHQVTGDYCYFVDDNFQVIDGLPDVVKYEFTQQTTPLTELINFSEITAEELKYVPSAVEFLSQFQIGYEKWVRCGMALASLGEEGRDYFINLSNNHNYTEDTLDTINKKYDNLLSTSRGDVKIATLFEVAIDLGYEYEEPRTNPQQTKKSLCEKLQEMFVRDDMRDPNKLLGFPLNKFKELANNTDGIQPGFYLLGAESNVGKTAVMTNLCLDALMTNSNLQVIYLSLDDSLETTVYRFLGIMTGLEINSIKKPKKLFPYNLSDLEKCRNEFIELVNTGRLILKDIGEVHHVKHLEDEIKKIKDKKNLIVFIDGLYNLPVGDKFNSIREENIERARLVKMLVDTYGLPMIATGEVRKKNQEQSKDKAPTMHDLMESGKYAYNASIVWTLYAEKFDDLKSPIPALNLEYVKNKLSSYKGKQQITFQRATGTIEEYNQFSIKNSTMSNNAPNSNEDL